MSEPLLHAIVPFAAFALARLSWRAAILAGVAGLAPDLDALFFVHRSASHTALFGVLLLAAASIQSFRGRTALVAIGAGWLSHILLDLFGGYTPLLWPLYPWSLWIDVELTTRIASTPALTLTADIHARPVSFEPFLELDAPLFTSQGLMIAALLTAPVWAPRVAAVWRRQRPRG